MLVNGAFGHNIITRTKRGLLISSISVAFQEILRVSQAMILLRAILILKGELTVSVVQRWLLLIGLVIMTYVNASLWNYFINRCELMGMNMRAAMTALLYKKVRNSPGVSSTTFLNSNFQIFNILSAKNINRHTAHTINSWPNPKQWQMGHTSDLMMITR